MLPNLERWVSGIVARTFAAENIDDLALWSKRALVNALSDMYIPAQAVADMQTDPRHLRHYAWYQARFLW